MPLQVGVEVAVSDGITTTEKGGLLEGLSRQVLEILQYVVTERVRITGIEVDLLCRHKDTGEKVFVECKAHRDALSGDAITKLLGNVLFHGASSGWLLTTGPLGKDAKGLVDKWSERPPEERRKLVVLNSQRIAEVLADTGMVVAPHGLALPSIGQFGELRQLEVSNVGRFWLAPLVSIPGGLPDRAMLFDCRTGQPLLDRRLADQFAHTDSTLRDLQIVTPDDLIAASPGLEAVEADDSVVQVLPGDDWIDYRPARPQDFVGRREVQTGLLQHLESVRTGASATRLVAVKSPSGWGKSSLLVSLASRARNVRNRNKFFVFPVDLRAAISGRYAGLALLRWFQEAAATGFISPTPQLSVSNPSRPLDGPGFDAILRELREQGRVIALFFDQFEETFSKSSLSPLFQAVTDLANAVDAAQENLVLGFAWKTDGTIPQEHPAYYMWQSLADRRREFSLTPFDQSEVAAALARFSKELGSPLNPLLGKVLADQCQGFPWLLKKLCIHLLRLVQQG